MWCHPLLNRGFWVFNINPPLCIGLRAEFSGSSRFACRRMTPSQPYRRATDDGHLTKLVAPFVWHPKQKLVAHDTKSMDVLFFWMYQMDVFFFFIFFLHSHWFYPHSCWSNIHFHCQYPNRSVSLSIGSEFLLKCQALVDTSPWTLLKFQCCHWLNLNPCWLNWHFRRSNPSIFPEIRRVLLLNSQFLLSTYHFFLVTSLIFVASTPTFAPKISSRMHSQASRQAAAVLSRARLAREEAEASRRVALVMTCWAGKIWEGNREGFLVFSEVSFSVQTDLMIWIYWDLKVFKVQSHINMYLHKL